MIDLTQYQELIVRQQVEYMEAITGFETENRYNVSTPDGPDFLHAYEESGGLGRFFLRNHRPLKLHVVDDNNELVMTAWRSFFWLFSHLHVVDANERPVGSLRRQFALLGRRFTIEDAQGEPIAEIRGRLLRPNTFMFYRDDQEVARVTKQWSGIMREALTDADTFLVQMDTRDLGQGFAMLVLASAFVIDLDFFENSGGRGS